MYGEIGTMKVTTWRTDAEEQVFYARTCFDDGKIATECGVWDTFEGAVCALIDLAEKGE